jgi:hypothetical protein
MIKRYLIDLLCIGLMGVLAFLFAEEPRNLYPAKFNLKDSRETLKDNPERCNERTILRSISSIKALDERNIFSLQGSPIPSKSALPTSSIEKSYMLIGILKGEENKAIFRDQTGSIIALTVGMKLDDGSILTHIGTNSVELIKGIEKKEVRLFNIPPPNPLSFKK